jgi:hypothetical protein
MTCYLFISALTLLLGLTWPIFDLIFRLLFSGLLFSAWPIFGLGLGLGLFGLGPDLV